MKDHDSIFLQPACCASEDVGRLWCEHDAPENCEDGVQWTHYVRADLAEAEKAELRAEVERLRAMLPQDQANLTAHDSGLHGGGIDDN